MESLGLTTSYPLTIICPLTIEQDSTVLVLQPITSPSNSLTLTLNPHLRKSKFPHSKFTQLLLDSSHFSPCFTFLTSFLVLVVRRISLGLELLSHGPLSSLMPLPALSLSPSAIFFLLAGWYRSTTVAFLRLRLRPFLCFRTFF